LDHGNTVADWETDPDHAPLSEQIVAIKSALLVNRGRAGRTTVVNDGELDDKPTCAKKAQVGNEAAQRGGGQKKNSNIRP